MKKKKPTNKKKPVNSKHENTRKNTKNLNERFYPELNENQELAVIKMCAGDSISDVAKELGLKINTIYDWRAHNEKFKEALQLEWSRIISESRDIHSEMIRQATKNVFKHIKSGDPLMSYQFLKDSGFLPSSMDKTEKDRLAQELAEKLINVANQS